MREKVSHQVYYVSLEFKNSDLNKSERTTDRGDLEYETGENRLHLEKKQSKAQLVNSVNVYCYRAVSPPEPCESPPDRTLACSVETLERQERAWVFCFCANYVQKLNADADLSCDVSCVSDAVFSC